MNLIEKLGGYEKAKDYLKNLESIPMCEQTEDAILSLPFELLEYRRANNIFEVGDAVVLKDPNDALDRNKLGKGEVLEIKNINFSDHLIFECSPYGHSQKWFKHATDAEIKAGHRIDHGAPTNEGADNFSHFDHCSDIRNHISPNTVVIER